MASAAAATAEVVQKGALIGRYLVLGLIGRGGMGEVYAAYDPELDRKVALKLLRGRAARGGDEEGRVRLLREAQAIAKLSHPNVIVVHDVGTIGDSVFITMEFIEGSTIGYWLHAQPRGWREVLDVFTAAGRGLMAAHGAGIVHRDFKPDNVMLTKDGQVRVMDFGLARQVGEADPVPASTVSGSFKDERLQRLVEDQDLSDPDLDATAPLGPGSRPLSASSSSTSGSYLRQKLTQTGALVGTPAYMAPEQFASTATDERTDQFAFCIALYEGLYGQRPFEGDSVVALMTNVVSGTIRAAPPSTPVPARLRKVVLRGLEVDPAQRHASMAELLAALAPEPARGRVGWLAAGVGAVALAAAAIGARHAAVDNRASACAGASGRLAGVWEPGQPSKRKEAILHAFVASGNVGAPTAFSSASALLDRYADAWVKMHTESCEATQLRGEQSAEVLDLRTACLTDRLSQLRALTDIFASADTKVVDNAVSAAGALPTLDRCADVAMLKTVIPPPDDPGVRTRVDAVRDDIARARAMFDSGQCTAGLGVARQAVKAAMATSYLPVEAEAEYVTGRFGDFCADEKESTAALEQAVWTAESSRHDEVVAEASVFLVTQYAERFHDVRTARLWAHHAEATLAHMQGHPLLKAYLAVEWGVIFQAEGNHAEAIRQQRLALDIKQQVLGPMHPDTAISLMNVGLALHELGDDASAEPISRQAVETMQSVLGRDSAQTAMALLDYGEVLLGGKKLPDARDAFTKAIQTWTAGGASPFFIAYGRFDLGQVALAENRDAEARTLFEGALAEVGQDPLLAARTRFYLAETMWPTRRERAAALTLARDSRKALVAAAAPPARLAEVDAWLGTHRP